VALDMDDLDDEDLKALAEVSRKGYYHGRPRNDQSAPPVPALNKVSIAFTMVSMEAWRMEHSQSIDNAVFNVEPPAQRLDGAQEAMTLGNFRKGMMPWGGWTQYGFVFGLGKSSNFWRYFQKDQSGAVCGQSHDGFRCCPACREPLGDMTYEQFMAQVTPIISQTGKNSWNEFDVNGLSGPDLYGPLIDYTNDKNWHKAHPDDATMCNFLAKANPKRTTAWPIYVYQYVPGQDKSSVSVEKYLDCGSSVEVVQV